MAVKTVVCCFLQDIGFGRRLIASRAPRYPFENHSLTVKRADVLDAGDLQIIQGGQVGVSILQD